MTFEPVANKTNSTPSIFIINRGVNVVMKLSILKAFQRLVEQTVKLSMVAIYFNIMLNNRADYNPVEH